MGLLSPSVVFNITISFIITDEDDVIPPPAKKIKTDSLASTSTRGTVTGTNSAGSSSGKCEGVSHINKLNKLNLVNRSDTPAFCY